MSTTRARLGAGLAALVGLSLLATGSAQAAPFDGSGRLGGSSRYATAALVAGSAWSSASTVVVANGETNGIDALSASYLAGVLDAPIVLTTGKTLPAETRDLVQRLAPSKVVVVGGETSVSPAVYAELTAGRGGQRIAGSDRFDTAAKVVEAALATGAPKPTSVFLARGDLYGSTVAADALAASPVAFRAKVPVLLVEPGALPVRTQQVLSAVGAPRVYALGSTNSVGAAVAEQARALTSAQLVRLEGADRTATAAAIAGSDLASAAGFSTTAVGLANGYSIDALAAGPAAGRVGYPLLLTASPDQLGTGTEEFLRRHGAGLIQTHVFGGPASVSPTATASAQQVVSGEAQTPKAPDHGPVTATVGPGGGRAKITTTGIPAGATVEVREKSSATGATTVLGADRRVTREGDAVFFSLPAPTSAEIVTYTYEITFAVGGWTSPVVPVDDAIGVSFAPPSIG